MRKCIHRKEFKVAFDFQNKFEFFFAPILHLRKDVGRNVEIRARVRVRSTFTNLEMMNNKALKGTSSLKCVIS